MVWLDAEGDGRGLIADHDDQENEWAASWRDRDGEMGGDLGPELPRGAGAGQQPHDEAQ